MGRPSRRGALVAAMLVGVLGVAGCTSSEKSSDRRTEDRRPPGTRWAQAFCTAYDTWLTAVTKRLDTARLTDPAQGPSAAQRALIDAAAGARDDTAAARGQIDAAGDPAVPDGAVIAVDIINAFEQAETAFSNTLGALQALNPNDSTQLIPGAQGARAALTNALAAVRNQLASSLSAPDGGRLTAALAAAPACDELFA